MRKFFGEKKTSDHFSDEPRQDVSFLLHMFSFHPENVGAFLLGNRALNMKNAKDDETG